MMPLKKGFRNLILRLLNDYVRNNTFISRCYIRHSMALGAQNPFLSDLDLALFVRAGNFSELQKAHKTVGQDLGKLGFLRNTVSNLIILPHTARAYGLCRQYYPFRSIYPMQTWFLCGSSQKPAPAAIQHSMPLDHAPESTFFYYMIPVLRGHRRLHILEPLLIKRIIQKDCLWAGINGDIKQPASFYEALLTDIDIWGRFYKKMDYADNNSRGIILRPHQGLDYTPFMIRWDSVQRSIDGLKEDMSSLWISPSSMGDNWPDLVINLRASVAAPRCRSIITAILKTFEGLDYMLSIGCEESMIGRVSGLSRLNLLEPWLFKYRGRCLYGDPAAKENVAEPGMDTLRNKYREFLLYLFYNCLKRDVFHYNIYKLCFTMDYLFKYGEIILEEDRLSAIYGNEFIPGHKFNYPGSLPSFLSSLEKRHDFSLFSNQA